MAEGIFNFLVEKENLHHLFFSDSAGTAGYHIGELPDERMIETALRYNIRLTHRARQLANDDFEKFDYFLVMDKSNHHNIQRLKEKVSLEKEPKVIFMRSFDELKDSNEVPDPYYGSDNDFEEVYQILLRANINFIKYLKEEHLVNNELNREE